MFSYTSGATTSNSTSSFNVVYRSATTYKVTTTLTSGSTPTSTDTAWILKNGTTIAVAISVGGQAINETGSLANSMIAGVFAGFYEEMAVGQNQAFYAAETQYFHSTGTSTATVGSNQVKVTNYAANSANELVDYCGSTVTYSTFALSVGTPSGTTFPVVTSLQFAGTQTVNGAPENFAYGLQLTAFTIA